MSTPVTPAFRRSPVRFAAEPLERAARGGWDVVLRYLDEDDGPWLIDLSHRARWDFQDRHLDRHQPLGLPVPPAPGDVLIRDGIAINRMNKTQVALWHLGAGTPPSAPPETAFTETTDGHCMLAFLGSATPAVMEHLTNLDLFHSVAIGPRLTQGPVLHVPCQVVTLGLDCVVATFSRGYGQTFVDAALAGASPCDLRPGGEALFNDWFARLAGP